MPRPSQDDRTPPPPEDLEPEHPPDEGAVPQSLETNLFQEIIQATTDAVFSKDLEGRYTLINEAGARFLGKSVSEVLGKTDRQIVSEADARKTVEHDLQVLASGQTLTYEDEEILAGAPRHWLSTKGVLRDARGRITGLFGIARDISERKRAEQALKESEARFRAASDGSLDAFFLLRREPLAGGGIDFSVVHLNPHAQALVKRPSAAGERLSALLPSLWEAGLSLSCERSLQTRAPVEGERQARAADGEARWFQYQVVPLPEGVALTLRDVTDRKRLEAQVRLTGRLNALGTLAAGVAHELNNPLSYLLGNLELMEANLEQLERDSAPPLVPELRQFVREAMSGASKVALIVRDLRGFSRPEEDKLSEVDVRQTVEWALKMAKGVVHDHGVRVETELIEVPQVLANASRLSQVFLNLVINAAQCFHAPSERNLIRITLTASEMHVMVDVTDNGSGIPAQHLASIFDPFFTTKPVGEGTGLGLWICHNIVRDLGGEILVESELGRGTTFRVLLPIKRS